MTAWISGLFGLLGVVLGAGLTSLWEHRKQRRNERKDAAYLAAIVSSELERFSSKCFAVVLDNGLREGQRDEHGCRAPQLPTPEFDHSKFNVEWRSLPPDLMFEILDLPYRIELANKAIAEASDYAAEPPDYEEFFETRQYEFATLGIDASALATALRKLAGYPAHVYRGDFNPTEEMEHVKASIRRVRNDRRERRALQDLDA